MGEEATYHYGDIANGHVLGTDNQWHPITTATPSATMTLLKASYRHKFKRRWRTCSLVGLILGVVVAFQNWAGSGGGMNMAVAIDFVAAVVGGGLLYGLIICLIAALFPGTNSVPSPHDGAVPS